MRVICVILTAVASIAGCSIVDPNRVGNGQYLQQFDAAGVVMERETSQAGLKPCPTFAYEAMQANPGLKGRVRCSQNSSTDSLPYSFKAWIRETPQSDEKLLSSPFTFRFRNSEQCRSSLDMYRRTPKMEILEDFCNVPQGGQTNASPSASTRINSPVNANATVTGMGSRLTIFRLDAPVMQIATRSSKDCSLLAQEHATLLRKEASDPGLRYGCTDVDASDGLPFASKLNDELYGVELGVRAITDVMCRSTLGAVAKIRPANVDQARYRVTMPCQRVRTGG